METFGLVLILLGLVLILLGFALFGYSLGYKDGKLKQQEEDNFKFLDEIIDKIKQEEDKQ